MLSLARRLVFCSALPTLLALVAPPMAAQQPQPAAPTLAITVGTLHPVSGPAVSDGVILLAGDRIVAVGARGQVAIPPGVPVQNFPGAHAYPGLIDAHAQFGLPEGGLAEVDAGTKAGAALDPSARDIAASLAAGITTGHVTAAAAGRWLGQGALVQPRPGSLPALPGEGAVHMRLTAGAGTHPVARLKELADLSRPFEEAQAHVKALAKRKDALAQYDKDWAAYLEAKGKGGKPADKPADKPAEAKEGEAGEAKPAETKPGENKPAEAKRPTYPPPVAEDAAKLMLAAVADGKLRLRIEAERREEIRAALGLVRDLKLGQVTLLGASDAAAVANEIAVAGVGVILTPTGAPVELDGEPLDANLAGALHARGVKVAIASGDAKRAAALPLLAASCVGAGLDPQVAVRALTLTPAELLGIEREVGSLEVGKRADILLTSAPLLRSDARVLRVFAGGQTVYQGR